jgi:branched-chain amino acid transport system permease protein
MLKVIWGPNQLTANHPEYLRGSWEIGDMIIIKYRVFIIAVGLLVFAGVQFLLKNTKIGLVVRAGVMNKEMVQALGINIKKVFMFVFMIGSGMAALEE